MSGHLSYVEAAPAAPGALAAAEAIAGLVPYVVFLASLALRLIFMSTIGWLLLQLADLLDNVSVPIPHFADPHPLRFAATALRKLVMAVSNSFGWVAVKSEHSATWLFHRAADDFHRMVVWAEAFAHATVAAVEWANTKRKALRAETIGLFHKQRVQTHKQTAAQIHTATKAIGHTTTAKVKAETHARQTAIAHEHALTFPRVGRLEREYHSLTSEFQKIRSKLAPLAFAGATALALSRLGLGWLRCPALGRAGRKIGCRGFGFLEELLALSFVPLVLSDACRLVHEIERLAVKLQPELAAFVLGVEGWLCGGPSSLPSAIEPSDLRRVPALPSGL